MNARAFERSHAARSENVDREIQRQRTGMKKIEWPEINRPSSEIGAAGRLRNDGRTGGCEWWLPHCENAELYASQEKIRLRSQIQRPLHRPALGLNLLLQQSDGIDELFGARRTTGNVNVYRNDLVHTLHQSVIVEHAA